MTETQTPPPACSKCGDTGTIPPFMDACSCGAMPTAYAPPDTFAGDLLSGLTDATLTKIDGETYTDLTVTADAEEIRPIIPGTTITTPGFPHDPTPGQLTTRPMGGTYVYDGAVWKAVKTETLTAAQYHAKYGSTSNPGPSWTDEAGDTLPPGTEIIDEAGDVVGVIPAPYVQWNDEIAEFVEMAIVDIDREADDAAIYALRAAELEETDGEYIPTDLEPVALIPELITEGPSLPAGSHVDWSGVLHTGDTIADTVAAAAKPLDLTGMITAAEETIHVVASIPAAAMTDYAATGLKEKMASAPQGALLARLIAERDGSNILVQAAKSECTGPPMTAKRASQLIDALVKLPSVGAVRVNKYDGSCGKCTGNVAAGTGRIEKSATTGRWVTYHLTGSDCITEAEKVIADASRVDEPGLYRLGTDIYRVRHARGSKRLYGEKVVTRSYMVYDVDGVEIERHKVAFVYNGNAMRLLTKASKLTWAEARAFGKAYGACIACGRTLSDPRSLVQQYGSTCAGHYHWPTVTLKQAEAIIAGIVTWEEVTGALV